MSDIAYLDRTVVERVKRPNADPQEVERRIKQSARQVAGFNLAPERLLRKTVVETMEVEHADALKRYQNECTQLSLELAKHEVDALCFVPQRAWRAMCKEAGLVFILPSNNGAISVDMRAFRSLLGNDLSGHGLWVLPTILIWATATIWAGLATESGMIGFWSGCGAAILFAVTSQLFSHWYDKRRIKRRLATLPHDQVIRALFSSGEHNSWTNKVKLPDPPQSVAEILWRCAGLNLRVVAEPAAVTFEHEGLVQDMHAFEADPIIYIEGHYAVALVAQFGKFPIEQAVIDRCLSTAWY